MNEGATSTQSMVTRSALLLLGATGAALVYLSTAKYGVGITSVSCDYVAAAHSLMQGKGLLLHDGTPYLDFPPLLPLLLALLGRVGIDPLESMRFLSAISFGAIVFLTGVWLQRRVASRLFVVLGAASILFSLPVLNASIFAWPEAMFSLIVVLFLFELETLAETGARGSLVRAAVWAGLACSLRYIGVTLVATAIVCILLGRERDVRDRLRRTAIVLVVSLSPLLAWLIRNHVVSGTFAGERGSSPYPFVGNLADVLSILGGWFFSLRVGPAPRVALMAGLVLALVGVFVATGRTGHRETPTTIGPGRVLPATVFILVYTGTMVVLASTIALDRMNSRFLVPVYAPLLWVVVGGLENLRLVAGSRRLSRMAGVILTIGLGVWVAYWARVETRWVARYYHHGAGGLSTDEWRNSETIARLNEQPIRGIVYSNEPWALYMLAGMSARLSPRKHLFHAPESPTDDVDRFLADASQSNVYLVWIRRFERTNLLTLDELGAVCRLESLAQYSDGAIYAVK